MENFFKKQGIGLLAVLVASIALIISSVNAGPQGVPGSSGANGAPGATGPTGPSGSPGVDGNTPYIGFNGNWWIDDVDSGIPATGGTYLDQRVPYHTFTLSPYELSMMAQVGQPDFTNPEIQASYIADRVDEGYQVIETASDLMAIDDPLGKYILSADLDFALMPSWQPIMFADDMSFGGTLDGAGFRILNLSSTNISESISLDYLGLFRTIRRATITNLNFENIDLDILAVNQNVSKNLIGVLAGTIELSEIRFVALDNVVVTGVETIGALSGSIGNSILTNILTQSVLVQGRTYIGGLSGDAWDNIFYDVSTDTEIIYQGNYIGGLVGNSYYNRYLDVTAQTVMPAPMGLDASSYLDGIGGMTGRSFDDRFVNATSFGNIAFNPSQDLLTWTQVGGITGFAQNTGYLRVENFMDITMSMGDTYATMAIKSIGGIVGASEHVIIDQAVNYGQIAVEHPLAGLDEFIYILTNDYPIEYLGGIIGYAYGSAYLTYVLNLGDLFGVAEVGGILGSTGAAPTLPQQHVIIQRTMNEAEVHGEVGVGGIVGVLDVFTEFTILDTANLGNVLGRYGIGGIVGGLLTSLGVSGGIINSYNAGDLFARDYGAGGLIGGAYVEYDQFYPVQGNISIINSFTTGEIMLDLENLFPFFPDTIGSVIGYRQLQIQMLGVAYLVQEVTFDETIWNGSSNVLTGNQYVTEVPNVGWGNRVDMTPIYQASYLQSGEDFIYRTAWNFATIWTTVPFQNHPVILFPFID